MKTVIFDWKRTLYDPDRKELVKGALNLLSHLKNKNIDLVLIGKGGEDMQEEVDRLKVRSYFKTIVFAQGDKDPKVFADFISDDPGQTILIGDRVRSELEIGNNLGATTIWIKQGKFANEEPESEDQKPNYTVISLKECISLMDSLI